MRKELLIAISVGPQKRTPKDTAIPIRVVVVVKVGWGGGPGCPAGGLFGEKGLESILSGRRARIGNGPWPNGSGLAWSGAWAGVGTMKHGGACETTLPTLGGEWLIAPRDCQTAERCTREAENWVGILHLPLHLHSAACRGALIPDAVRVSNPSRGLCALMPRAPTDAKMGSEKRLISEA